MITYPVHVNVKIPQWMADMVDSRAHEGETRSSTIRRLLLVGIMEVEDDG